MPIINFIHPKNSDVQFERITFPDGQPHIKLDMASLQTLDKNKPVYIITRINNPNDLLIALMTKEALDHLEFNEVHLHVSYLMAARMDRVMLEGEPFSLKVVARMLNMANFKKIKIFDPHSEVTTALIDRSYSILNHRFAKEAIEDYLMRNPTDSFCLVSPDAGALKKIHKLAHFLQIEKVIECTKERDLKTGRLTSFKTTEDQLTGLTCFIIDDICDGGGTFSGTAKMLKRKGALNVVLIVSHGIFSKGTNIEAIDSIYSTDSYKKTNSIYSYSIEKYILPAT